MRVLLEMAEGSFGMSDMAEGSGMTLRELQEIQNVQFSKFCVHEVLEKLLQN